MLRRGGMEADVAVKVLRRDLDPAGEAVRRLRDEARLLARLDHPAILRVHDLVVLEGRVGLVCEFVEGEDLSGAMVGPGRLGPRALLEVLAQVASALAAAWSTPLPEGGQLALVHRDVKPSNVRVGRAGDVRLLDFGLARAQGVEREAHTRTDLLVGSPPYMAPERFLDAEARSASDVFSVAAVLFEGLTGERWYGDRPLPMLVGLAVDPPAYAAHVEQRLELLPEIAPDGVAVLLAESLSYDPDTRPTAAALAERLDELADAAGGVSLARWCRERTWAPPAPVAGELAGRTVTEGSLVRSEERPSSRGWAVAVAVAVVIAVGVGVATWALGGFGVDPDASDRIPVLSAGVVGGSGTAGPGGASGTGGPPTGSGGASTPGGTPADSVRPSSGTAGESASATGRDPGQRGEEERPVDPGTADDPPEEDDAGRDAPPKPANGTSPPRSGDEPSPSTRPPEGDDGVAVVDDEEAPPPVAPPAPPSAYVGLVLTDTENLAVRAVRMVDGRREERPLPGRVPVGEWRVYAHFTLGTNAREIEAILRIEENQPITVTCSEQMKRCRWPGFEPESGG